MFADLGFAKLWRRPSYRDLRDNPGVILDSLKNRSLMRLSGYTFYPGLWTQLPFNAGAVGYFHLPMPLYIKRLLECHIEFITQ